MRGLPLKVEIEKWIPNETAFLSHLPIFSFQRIQKTGCRKFSKSWKSMHNDLLHKGMIRQISRSPCLLAHQAVYGPEP